MAKKSAQAPREGAGLRHALEAGLNSGLALQHGAVVRLAAGVGVGDPDVSPGKAVAALEQYYSRTVVGLGITSGVTAFVPGPGTVAGALVNVGEVGVFLEATVLFCLVLAEIHSVDVTDLDRRRLLVTAVILGDAGANTVKQASERIGKHWARKLVTGIPTSSLKQVNKVLSHNFVTKYGTKQGVLVLGRELPFAIGGVVGGAGNYVLARGTIKAAREAFGPPPKKWRSPE